MKIRFFKYNYSRQILSYGFILFFAMALYDAWNKGIILVLITFLSIIGFLLAILIYQYFSLIIINEEGIAYHSILKNIVLSGTRSDKLK